MHDWVVSTNQNAATGNALSESYTDIDGNVHTNDTAAYRLAKFKTEFEEYFNMHYALIYYVYTFFALMVDQRAKNMFLTYWGSTGTWYAYYYDNDTCFGIDNEGRLTFDYYHEDTDTINDANVYNGQNSTLWKNFREAFSDEIQETYQKLRSDKLLTYDKLINQFITNGSDKWSESIYNEDSEFKYVSMLKSDNDASNLTQLRGSGEEHLRYFIENRINYCDSKWYASEYADDYARLRIYTPDTWAGIAPNADITVTYFSNIYAGVRYGANATLHQERVEHSTPITFEAPENKFNNTETAIYGASQLSSLGDLSPLYCGGIVLDKASKLIELKIGDTTEGYTNDNLVELSVGTNKLLKEINICNCPNLTDPLNLSGCPNIEEVYATGSGITGVELVDGGCLKIAKLPATITNLTLKNQMYIEELTLESYDSLKTLWVEGTPAIDTLEILENATNLERVRLTNVNWSYPDTTMLYELIERNLAGIDENGTNTNTMWIDGKCHIESLTGAEYLEVKEAFPYLTITYDNLVSYLTFMSEDGKTQLAKVAINNGGDGTYSGSTPTKSSTAQYTYTFAGWSLTPGGSANSNALKNVEADRIVYAAFSSTLRKYTVKFYNYDGTLLQTVNNVAYGGTATYTGSTPTNNSTGNTVDFQFYGWSPSPSNIQGDTNCYAQYNDLREITDSWATIKSNVDAGTALTKYGVGAFKTLDIGAKDLPYSFTSGSVINYNDEIHILGGSGSSFYKNHYKWNGTEWTSVSTLPYPFYASSAIVYNNEIHILGTRSNTSYYKRHYKWDGTSWTSVSTLPYEFYCGSAFVYNNEIHIIGTCHYSADKKLHYKWNGAEWTSVSTLPYDFANGSSVMLNNEIHIMGGDNSSTYTNHYKWDGTSWTSVSVLPYDFSLGSALIYNNEIHIIGSNRTGGKKNHYKWDGTSWTSVSVLPYDFDYAGATIYDGELYILGANTGYLNENKKFYTYSFETSTWSKVGVTESIPMQLVAHNHDDLPDGVCKWESVAAYPGIGDIQAIVYNDEIHMWAFDNASYKIHHVKLSGSGIETVSTAPTDIRGGIPVIWNNEIHVIGSVSMSNGMHHYKWDGSTWTSVSTLPYNFSGTSVVVYNDKIHIMGNGSSSNVKDHYAWDGTSWTSVSTLPYSCYDGVAVVYNNKIHLMGSYYSGTSATSHYTWDGSAWTTDVSLPYQLTNDGCAIVYNGELYLLGLGVTNYDDKVYKLDSNNTWVLQDITLQPTTRSKHWPAFEYKNELYISSSDALLKYSTLRTEWQSLGELPYGATDSSVVVYNNEIHLIGSNSSTLYRKKHYKWNGSSWASVSTLPYNFYQGSAVIYNNEIHILGSYDTSSRTNHYKWDGSSWTSASTLPYDFYDGSAVVYNDEIHIIGANTYGNDTKHYKWNGTEWISASTLPYNFYYGCAVVYNNEIHILGTGTSALNRRHYKWNGTEWTSVSTLPYQFDRGRAVIYNNEIHIIGTAITTNFKDHYKWNGNEWIQVSTLPYNFQQGSVVVYDNEICVLGNAVVSYIKYFYTLKTIRPKATLTFIAKNLLSEVRDMDEDEEQLGGWTRSDMRTWLNGDFLATLPSDLQTAITEVEKISDKGRLSRQLQYSNDKIWLLSASEVGLSDSLVMDGQGTTYSIFTDNNSRKRRKVDGKSDLTWWLRSTSYYDTTETYYGLVGFGGALSTNRKSYWKDYILIGFCI